MRRRSFITSSICLLGSGATGHVASQRGRRDASDPTPELGEIEAQGTPAPGQSREGHARWIWIDERPDTTRILNVRASIYRSDERAWQSMRQYLVDPTSTIATEHGLTGIRLMLPIEYELPEVGTPPRSDIVIAVTEPSVNQSLGVCVVSWIGNVVLECLSINLAPAFQDERGLLSDTDETIRMVVGRLAPTDSEFSEQILLGLLPTEEEAQAGGVPIKKSEIYQEF